MKTVTFKCPRGSNHEATPYSSGQAGCSIHGWLLYTEIPHESLVAMRHKIGGWKTIKAVWGDLKQSIASRAASVLKGKNA